jgi:hypothetical protein
MHKANQRAFKHHLKALRRLGYAISQPVVTGKARSSTERFPIPVLCALLSRRAKSASEVGPKDGKTVTGIGRRSVKVGPLRAQ